MSNLRLKIIVSLYSIDQLYNDTYKNKINQNLEKGAPSMMNKTYAPIKVIFVPSDMREALISPEDESLVDAAGRPKRILVKDPATLATLLNPNDFLDFVHFNFALATLEGAYAKPFGDMIKNKLGQMKILLKLITIKITIVNINSLPINKLNVQYLIVLIVFFTFMFNSKVSSPILLIKTITIKV